MVKRLDLQFPSFGHLTKIGKKSTLMGRTVIHNDNNERDYQANENSLNLIRDELVKIEMIMYVSLQCPF